MQWICTLRSDHRSWMYSWRKLRPPSECWLACKPDCGNKQQRYTGCPPMWHTLLQMHQLFRTLHQPQQHRQQHGQLHQMHHSLRRCRLHYRHHLPHGQYSTWIPWHSCLSNQTGPHQRFKLAGSMLQCANRPRDQPMYRCNSANIVAVGPRMHLRPGTCMTEASSCPETTLAAGAALHTILGAGLTSGMT